MLIEYRSGLIPSRSLDARSAISAARAQTTVSAISHRRPIPLIQHHRGGNQTAGVDPSYRLAMRIDSRTELVVAADIAKRLGLSRARVSVLATGPGFPRPIGRLGRSDVWRWSSVERWARETGRLHPAE